MKLKIVLFFLAFSCSCGLLVQGSTFYSCPEIPQDMVSICSEDCTDDSDCENETKCCSNGCGHVCKVPVRIPYYDPPLECPDLSGNQNAGICEQDCSDNTECTNEGELCCSNGCGTACMQAVPASPRCSAVRDQVLNGTALIGAYIPQCDDDGNFSPTQCWGSTGSCWCVDTQSGEPVSDMIQFKEPQCTKEDPVFYSCPPLEGDVIGACAEMCSGDSDCENGQKCCSNGCGHSCRDPMSIPYISPPLTCPEIDTLPGLCDMPPCEESNCPKGQFCCENPCGGKMCAEGVRRCSAIEQQMANTTDHLLGAFEPQCDPTTGKFQLVQCHSHYCWCVDPDDGKPTSEVVLSVKMNELECTETCPIEGQVYMECASACPPTCASPNPACIAQCVEGCQCPTGTVLDEDANKCIDPDNCSTGCTYNGQTYANGETFPDIDNCNTCTCFGSSVGCTEMACVPGCTHNGQFYEEGEGFDKVNGCNTCWCLSGGIACADVTDCGEDDEDGGLWWHSLLIASGGAIILLSAIVVGLLVVVCVVIRQNSYRHKRLQEVDFSIIDELDDVSFKKQPDVVEMKGPVDDSEPTKA